MPKIDVNTSYERNTRKQRKQSIINAIRRGYFSHVRYLLENTSIDPNEIYQSSATTNSIQVSPTLLLPVISNTQNPSSLPVITNLTQIINSIYSFNGRTPLMFCASIEDETWSYGIAQNLIEKGAKVGLKDPHGLNALMYACIHQKKSLVRLYLNAPGDYNVLGVDNFGNTAMHIASLGHLESICKILNDTCVKYDINPLTDIPKNKFGHTPFDLCIANGHKSCINNFNTLNEYFSNKRAIKKKGPSRIQTAFKKEEANNHRVFSNPLNSSSVLGDYVLNSRVSSVCTTSSSHYYNVNSNHHHQYHNNVFNVNCPSVLFEHSESSIATSPILLSAINPKRDVDESHVPVVNITVPSRLTQQQSSQQSSNHYTAIASTSASLHHPSPLNTSSSSFSNILEIYKFIYPYKEQMIKVSVNEVKSPIKSARTNAVIYELRPLTSTKMVFTKGKNKMEDLKQQEPTRVLRSALVVAHINELTRKLSDDRSQMVDSQHFKSVSFSNINPIIEINAQQKSEQPKEEQQSTWRNSFNKLFDSLQSQNSDSYRKGCRYTASSIDQLAAVPAVNNLTNCLGRRMSMQRKSIVSSSNSFINLGRRQSNISSLINMKLHAGRRPSVTTNV